MRVFARRERPHPGAQLTLFEAEDGWRYSLWVTNLPASARRLARPARLHRRRPPGARPGRRRHPHRQRHRDRPVPRPTLFALNQAWLAAALIAATLLAWLRLLALDGALAKAEPKTLRYRILHAAARLTRGGRRRRLKIAATWPWAPAIVTAWERITALPQAAYGCGRVERLPAQDDHREPDRARDRAAEPGER